MDGTLDDRVTNLTRDLLEIQAALGAPAQPQGGLAPPRLSAEVARQFKSTVDNVRLVLWAYIDSCSSALGLESTLQKLRVERVVQMLRDVRGDIAQGVSPPSAEAGRLLSEIQAITELHKPPNL
jgi:hypothetical protein